MKVQDCRLTAPLPAAAVHAITSLKNKLTAPELALPPASDVDELDDELDTVAEDYRDHYLIYRA